MSTPHPPSHKPDPDAAPLGVSSFFDLEGSLIKSLEGFGCIRDPGLALILGIFFGLLALTLTVAVVVFDLLPTATYSMALAALVLPPSVTGFGALVGIMLTALPSLTQLLGPSLIRRGVRVTWLPIAGSVWFDGLSDYPVVAAFITTLDPLFTYHFGAAAPLFHHTALLLWLLCATIGFEMLLTISVVASLQLLWGLHRYGPR